MSVGRRDFDSAPRRAGLVLRIAVVAVVHVMFSLVCILATATRTDKAGIVAGVVVGVVVLVVNRLSRRGSGWLVYALVVVFALSILFWAYHLVGLGSGMAAPRIVISLAGLWLSFRLLTASRAGREKTSSSRWADQSRGLFLRRF